MGNNTQGQVILAKASTNLSEIKKSSDKKVLITREFSSGGIVYKQEKGVILWLVRKTSVSDLFPETHWMLPKGWLDDLDDGVPGPMASGTVKADEETLQKTAIREVAEETGVDAKIIKKVETIKYLYRHPTKGKVLKFVTFYLMEWVSDLPQGFDGETSEIAWLFPEEAYKRLSFSREKEVLKKAGELFKETSLV